MMSSLALGWSIHRSGAAAHRVVSAGSSEAHLELLAGDCQTAPSHSGVLGLHLPAHEPAPEPHGRYSGRPRPGERIEDQLAAIREEPDQDLHQRQGLLGLVTGPGVTTLVHDKHAVGTTAVPGAAAGCVAGDDR